MNSSIVLSDFFGEVFIPPGWKFLGVNNLIEKDDEDRDIIVSLGLVFYEKIKNIKIKITFTLESERYFLTERNAKGQYSTKCNFMKKELLQFNQFIQSNY